MDCTWVCILGSSALTRFLGTLVGLRMRREAHGCWRERRREGREDQGFKSSSLLERVFNSSSFSLDKGLNSSPLLKRLFNSSSFSLGQRFNSLSIIWSPLVWKLLETSPLSRSLENGRAGCLKVSFLFFFSPKESKNTQTKDKSRVEK